MSRDVCGICWCPYDDDGKCGCEPAPLVRDDTTLLRQALEALDGVEALLASMDVTHLLIYGEVDNAIAALRERLGENR